LIEESHNFRNGGKEYEDDEGNIKENRYLKLLNRVIRKGVKTKVLMLSATPVNIDFKDLRNQLEIATEGEIDCLNDAVKSDKSITQVFAQVTYAFNVWSKMPATERTAQTLLDSISFDFFELLDSVTIARSRKHIEFYKDENLGKFPERLKPLNKRLKLTDIQNIDYKTLYFYIDQLNLSIYNPLNFVQLSKLNKYVDLDTASGKSWENREKGRNIIDVD
jgi:hypothetical protein